MTVLNSLSHIGLFSALKQCNARIVAPHGTAREADDHKVKRTKAILLVFFFSQACLGVAQDTAGVGSISGVAKDVRGTAVKAARVCIQANRCSDSNDAGAFRIINVRPGSYRLEITISGQTPFLSPDVEVRAGLEASIEVTLPKIEVLRQSVTVSAPVFLVPEEVKTSGFLIQRGEISKAAGALQDVSRYLQSLPGVGIGSDAQRNDLIVRGGSPLENLFIVDNVEIPNINNFANFASAGGTTSLIDPALIQDVTFLTGGYPAPYGNSTSSVLQITQREGSREKFGGRLTLGSAGFLSGAILEGPIRKGKGSWVFSAKRSILDAFTSDIGEGGVPVNYNFNTRALYDLTPRDRIWLVNFTGVDTIRIGATSTKHTNDPNRDPELDLTDIRYQGWRSATGLNWQHLFGSRGVGLLGLTDSEANVSETVKDLLKFGLTAPTISQLIAETPALYIENNHEGESTIKYDLTSYLPVVGKLQVGGSFKSFRTVYDTQEPFGTDSPFSPVQNLNPFFLRKSSPTYQSAVYIQSSRNLTPRLNLTWGGRFDNYQALQKNRLSPRLGMSYRITDNLSWRSSYGIYYQQPLLLIIESFPQNAHLAPIRATHIVSGFSYSLGPSTRVTIEAYQKTYNSYPVSSQFRSFSLANAGDTFNVTDILFPYVSAGHGRSRGLEIAVERKFSDRWYGLANISISKARFSALDGVFRPSTFDSPVVFNSLGGYHFGKQWDASVKFAYLSGKPYTPFDQTLSQQQDRGIYDLTRVDGVRAPDYLRLDFRVDRTFTVRKQPFLVFFGLQDATNRRNVIAQAVWDRSLNEARFIPQLGLFPVIGFDWKF